MGETGQTHNIALARPIAEYVVSITSDGRVIGQDTVSEALMKDETLAQEIKYHEALISQNELGHDEPENDESNIQGKKSGKLVVAEEMSMGRLSWSPRERPFYSFNS
jgi:hypothetical protein